MVSQLNNFTVSIEKQGPRSISKASFPLRYGKYSEIRTSDYEFLFNLNGEIKFVRGLNPKWPHPAEHPTRLLRDGLQLRRSQLACAGNVALDQVLRHLVLRGKGSARVKDRNGMGTPRGAEQNIPPDAGLMRGEE